MNDLIGSIARRIGDGFVPMTREQEKAYPCFAILNKLREHAEKVHGATPEDYKLDIVGWHKKHYPECLFTRWSH